MGSTDTPDQVNIAASAGDSAGDWVKSDTPAEGMSGGKLSLPIDDGDMHIGDVENDDEDAKELASVVNMILPDDRPFIKIIDSKSIVHCIQSKGSDEEWRVFP